MTELEAIEAIYQRWTDGWALLHPQNPADPQFVPYGLDDESYKPTALGALGCWATIAIRHSSRVQATQGNPSSDEARGNVFVQLFGPKDKGVAGLVTLGEHVRTVLAKQRIGSVNMYAGRPVEPKKEPAWASRVLVIPFRYITTPT